MEWVPYVHDALEYIEENLLTIVNPKEALLGMIEKLNETENAYTGD